MPIYCTRSYNRSASHSRVLLHHQIQTRQQARPDEQTKPEDRIAQHDLVSQELRFTQHNERHLHQLHREKIPPDLPEQHSHAQLVHQGAE